MKMKTKNMQIRYIFKDLEIQYANMFRYGLTEEGNELQKDYHVVLFNCATNKDLNKIFSKDSSSWFRNLIINVALISTVLLNDTYIHLINKTKYNALTDEEKVILNNILKGTKDNNYKKLFTNSDMLEYMINISNKFIDESALKKVELMKSLNEEDLAILEIINPFYKEEYDAYNININDKFINKHLNIWINKEGYEKGITIITNFLFKIYMVNKSACLEAIQSICEDEETINKLMTHIEKCEFEEVSPYIRDIYDNKEKNLDRKI
jgi:hypothetical protein